MIISSGHSFLCSAHFHVTKNHTQYSYLTKFRKYRPPKSITPKLDPKAWIKYAITCVLSKIKERNEKWTWKYFAARRDRRKLYMDLYVKLKLETIEDHQIYEFDELEAVLTYEDIKMYRFLALKKLNLPKPIPKTQKAQNNSWVGWIAGMVSEPEVQESETSRELQQLAQVFDSSADSFEISDMPLTVTLILSRPFSLT
jgi:vacuolar protein sorting-associated protein 13A/C